MSQDFRSSEDSEQKHRTQKLPEFVFIDEEKTYTYEPGEEFDPFEQRFEENFRGMKKAEYPFSVRVFCFAAAVVTFFLCALALPLLLFFFFGNLLTFSKVEVLRIRMEWLWGAFKKLFVVWLGVSIAVISPAFGFSVILIYLMLQGVNEEEDWIARTMKSRFRR